MLNEPRENPIELDLPQRGAPSPAAEVNPVEEIRKNPLRSLWRRRWIVLTCAVIGLVVGYVVYWVSTPVFEGRARILVSQSGPKLLQQDFAGTLSSGVMWLQTQCDVIRSPEILRRVKESPSVLELPMFKTNPMLARDIVGYLMNATSATMSTRSEIISVAVRGPNADDAAALADHVVKAYRDFNDELKQTSASEVMKQLDRKKGENDESLRRALERRLQFQRDNAGLSFNREVRNPVLERVNLLSAALTQAEVDMVSAKAEYDTIKSMLENPDKIRQLLANPQYRGDSYTLRRELREMQSTMELMSATYLSGSPQMLARQQRLQRTKEEIEAEERAGAEAILASIEQKFLAAQMKAEQCRKFLNEQQAQVLNVNSKQADFDQIEAEILRMEKYSDQLADQMKSISLAESTGAMNVYVVEKAAERKSQVAPDLLWLLFKGLAAGMLAGVALAMLVDVLDQRLRSADEIKQVVGLPILGVIPHILSGRTPSERGSIVHTDPMSDVAESYRTVRTALYFGTPGGSVKTLLITSPAPGDGKTTLAANLGCAMAQAGNRVILLDCDFRKPAQHRVFELDKKAGMSNVLAGDMTIEQATLPTKVPGLSVVPCGPIPANPSEILNSQGFLDLLEGLSRSYDIVLIDSPPVLPVTDARVLAASCDGVLIALRAEKTSRSAATGARDLLTSVGGRILGLVVNDVSRRKGVYSYYYADEGRYAYYHYGPRRGPSRNGSGRSSNGAAAKAAETESA